MKPEAPREERSGFPAPGDADPHPAADTGNLWEKFFSRGNLAAALRRVERNAGSPGVDGMQTTELRSWLQRHWPEVRATLDPGFSERSFGFRPGRSAHDAIRRAQRDIAEGHEWAVDLDLDRFFDRVQHDALMARVARRVTDKKVLKLIRRYLEAGVMADGVKQPTEEGTPRGRPSRRCSPTSTSTTSTKR